MADWQAAVQCGRLEKTIRSTNEPFLTQHVDLLMAFMGVGNSGIFNRLDIYNQKRPPPLSRYARFKRRRNLLRILMITNKELQEMKC